jgi:hypothetical protein
VPVNKKDEYMEALEAGRVHQDISIFTKFIASWQMSTTSLILVLSQQMELFSE